MSHPFRSGRVATWVTDFERRLEDSMSATEREAYRATFYPATAQPSHPSDPSDIHTAFDDLESMDVEGRLLWLIPKLDNATAELLMQLASTLRTSNCLCHSKKTLNPGRCLCEHLSDNNNFSATNDRIDMRGPPAPPYPIAKPPPKLMSSIGPTSLSNRHDSGVSMNTRSQTPSPQSPVASSSPQTGGLVTQRVTHLSRALSAAIHQNDGIGRSQPQSRSSVPAVVSSYISGQNQTIGGRQVILPPGLDVPARNRMNADHEYANRLQYLNTVTGSVLSYSQLVEMDRNRINRNGHP